MSEIKSDRQLQVLLEGIASKLNGSAVLNGGFDRMIVMIEHIQEKQAEASGKIDSIQEGLYDPNTGLYTRVKTVEAAMGKMVELHAMHIAEDGKHLLEINENLKSLVEVDNQLEKKTATVVRLQKIAGDDLEKLESVIKVKSAWGNAWDKVVWLLVGGVVAAMGKALWEVFGHR